MIFKIGDTVRFTQSGDLGRVMAAYRQNYSDLYGSEPYVITEIIDEAFVKINDTFKAHHLELELANDFASVAKGDYVELSTGEVAEVDYVGQTVFWCAYSGGYLGLSIASGMHTNANPVRALRIVERGWTKPSDMVVKIGCLEGKVRPMWDHGCDWGFVLLHSDGNTSAIHLSALDFETRELVKSLLKAQEEK